MTLIRLNTHRGARALTAFIMGILVFAGTTVAESPQLAEPALVFEQVSHPVDVGYYPREFFMDFLFEVHGEGAVTIRSSSSTCPCTTVASDKTVYYPGQKGVIGVVYSYRGNVAPETQVIKVLTDRSSRPQSLQVVPRQARTGLWVERHELHWTGAPAGLAQNVEIEVAPELQGRAPVVELAVTSWRATIEPIEPSGRFRLTIQPLSDQAPAARAVIRLAPSLNPGATSHPNPEVAIELFPAVAASKG